MIETIQNKSKFQELKTVVDYTQNFNEIIPNPVFHNEFWSYGDYELVGHGNVTNRYCGKIKAILGCIQLKKHNYTTLDGKNYRNKIFVKKQILSCFKPTCPKCYKHGWATREALRIEDKLKEASKRFGLVEHIIVSPPKSSYGLSLEKLRHQVIKILRNRGVIGGVQVFHAFRYRNQRNARKTRLSRGWYFSPHTHVLGFVGGSGYGRCRNCKFKKNKTYLNCLECKGFEGVTRRQYKKDGYIVKVKGKRKTIGGTAWYQLHHSSIRRGSRRPHVPTWFGVCSYRQLKLINGKDVGNKFNKCPLCGSELVRLRYLGDFSKVDISRRGDVFDMFDAEGKPLWETGEYGKIKDG